MIYGGFGRNTYCSEKDGFVDQIFFKSDQWAENWLYGSAGNNRDGEKLDVIQGLDAFDRVFIQGVSNEMISVDHVKYVFNDGEVVEGLGIAADGFLEAVYTGNDMSARELLSLTNGVSI